MPNLITRNQKQLNDGQRKYWSKEENRLKQSQHTTNYYEQNPDAKIELSQQAKKQWQNAELLAWRKNKTKAILATLADKVLSLIWYCLLVIVFYITNQVALSIILLVIHKRILPPSYWRLLLK